jgi:hypothetical protein
MYVSIRELTMHTAGRLKKLDDPYVCVYANDTGEDVLGAVARALGQRPHEVGPACS